LGGLIDLLLSQLFLHLVIVL